MALGNMLEQLRRQRGWSLAEVARKLGLKYTTYVGYEKGEREPGHVFLISVAKLYGVTVDYLLETGIYPDIYQDANLTDLKTAEEGPLYGHENDDTNTLLEMLKNDPALRIVAKIQGELTPQGKKDLIKYAELLRNQRDTKWDD